MRLKTGIRASALLRQADAAGLFGAVLRKGDPDGGVILVVAREADGVRLYGERGGRFEPRVVDDGSGAVEAAIAREAEFDRDLWVLEVEGRGAGALLAAFEA